MVRTNPLVSVVIPTRATNFQILDNILDCLEKQTFQNFEVIIVCDRIFSKQERNEFTTHFEATNLNISFISDQNSKFTPHSQGGASYVRNQGIIAAQGKYIQLLDDDNEIDKNFLEKERELYTTYVTKYQKEIIITPTLLRRNTDKIQNQGFSKYNYRQARPQIHFLKENEEYAEIRMFSGNGIFGKAEIMKGTLYDEQIAWIAEDLDFVYSIREKGYPILVFKNLELRHQERDKTILEEAWIGNKKSAQQKIKNLFLRVKKHGNLREKTIFLLRSSRGITTRLSIKAYKYGNNEKGNIIKGLRKGYIQGWRKFLNK